MIALVLAAVIPCPLLSGGVLAYPTLDTFGYRLYIQNPSPFTQQTDQVELVVRAADKPEYRVEFVPLKAQVPAHSHVSVDIGPQPQIENPALVAGSHVDCEFQS